MSRHLKIERKSSLTSSSNRANWGDYSNLQRSYWKKLETNKQTNKKTNLIVTSIILIILISTMIFYGVQITGNVSYHTGISGGIGTGNTINLTSTTTYQQPGNPNGTGTNINLNLGWFTKTNNAPNITAITIDSTITPVEDSFVNVQVNFSVFDQDGASDINITSTNISLTRSGETPRETLACTNVSNVGDQVNFTCTVKMYYFDGPGSWTATATIKDLDNNEDQDSSASFTYQQLTAITISPATINFPEITRGATNQLPNQNLTINNTGNDDITDIRIDAVDLIGETNSVYIINAENFTVHTTTGSEVECDSGTALVNNTETTITGATLNKGNHSIGDGTGQELLHYCIPIVDSNLIKQAYSTALSRAWIIKVIASLAIFTIKNKKKKKKILEALKELKQELGISTEEIIRTAKTLKEEELIIPASLFETKLAPAESLIKYLKENLKMKHSEIASLLNRDDRTIWTLYQQSLTKKKTLEIKEDSIGIPIKIFSNRKLSILEAITLHLRKNKLSNVQIASLLNKDPRNIFTVYRRAQKKLDKQK